MLSRSLSRLQTYLFGGWWSDWGSDPVRVILIGLDAAGKTTFLYKVNRHGDIVTTIPTIGFNVETLCVRKAEITCWDVGGCDKIRTLWRHYTDGSAAVVMFVDSNDRDRMYAAKQELDIFLNDMTMVGVPLLVVANKQDLPRAATVEEVVNYLSLNDIVGHEWAIIPASVASGVGVSEIVNWIKRAAKEGRSMKARSPSESDAHAESATTATATSGHLIQVKPATPTSTTSQQAKSIIDTPVVAVPPLPPNSEDVRRDWMVRPDIPEEEFLALLDTFQLDIWDHYTHVRVAWVLLRKHGIEEGFKRIEDALRSFIEHSARTDHRSFHATMTRFWCHMIAYAMQWVAAGSATTDTSITDRTSSDQSSFKQFINAVCTKDSALGVAAPLWDKMLFKKYYSTSGMFRNEARAAPSPPDLLSLPDIAPLLKDTAGRDFIYVQNTVYWVKTDS